MHPSVNAALGCIACCMQHAYDRVHPGNDRKHAARSTLEAYLCLEV
jgi:DNA primase large subunit